MYKIKLADLNQIKESRDIWNSMVFLMKFPSIFCTWEWIFTWWEFFGANYEPLFIFIYDGGVLKGILPLALQKKAKGIPISLSRVLTYCGSSDLYSDHLDIISSEEEAEPCFAAVRDFLSSDYRDWDELQIGLLSEDSRLISLNKQKRFGMRPRIKEVSVSPFISLNGTFEEYMSAFNSKQRYNILSRKKKLYEQFGIEYYSCRSNETSEGLAALFRLHELRAGKKKIVSTFSGKNIFDFHHSLANRIKGNGWLWLKWLRNEKEIVSVLYAFAFGNRLFYYQVGLNPEWERYGPGNTLLYEVIKEAFSKGYIEFDFLRGGEEYKSIWTTERRSLYMVKFFNKTVRGECARMTWKLKEIARGILE